MVVRIVLPVLGLALLLTGCGPACSHGPADDDICRAGVTLASKDLAAGHDLGRLVHRRCHGGETLIAVVPMSARSAFSCSKAVTDCSSMMPHSLASNWISRARLPPGASLSCFCSLQMVTA